eukprot:767248-Hanusia_phi.AAC.2
MILEVTTACRERGSGGEGGIRDSKGTQRAHDSCRDEVSQMSVDVPSSENFLCRLLVEGVRSNAGADDKADVGHEEEHRRGDDTCTCSHAACWPHEPGKLLRRPTFEQVLEEFSPAGGLASLYPRLDGI